MDSTTPELDSGLPSDRSRYEGSSCPAEVLGSAMSTRDPTPDSNASNGGGQSSTQGEQVESADEDEFGGFVYAGKDSDDAPTLHLVDRTGRLRDPKLATRPRPRMNGYEGQLEDVLERERESDLDDAQRYGGGSPSGRRPRPERGTRDGATQLSSPSSSRVDGDEFPSLAAPAPAPLGTPPKRPLASRASFGGVPSPTPSSSSINPYPRRPSYHPQISRLRSVSTQSYPKAPSNRFVSSSTYETAPENVPAGGGPTRPPLFPSPSTSGFDQLSRRSSMSNVLDFPSASELPTASASSAPSTTSPSTVVPRTIKWSPLKRISSRLFPPGSSSGAAGMGQAAAESMAKNAMGTPTVLAVNGIVVVGTNKGWTGVFDFGQNLRCICGTEQIAKESGSVTAVAISQDHTFVAAGHENGSIHLYSLLKPSTPARSVPPTTLSQVLTGRKEGHLVGTRILHLGFIGGRHTAIVSADEAGLAFYHSLGKVLMLASTDIIRMLGRYPDPATYVPPSQDAPRQNGATSPPPAPASSSSSGPRKKPTTILSMSPLPLGPAPHPASDALNLVALLTPTKLVVVGLKPAPRTWWRYSFPREATEGSHDGGESSSRQHETSGIVGWWPSTRRTREGPETGDGIEAESKSGDPEKATVEPGEDPMLAWAWGSRVRIVKVTKLARDNEVLPKGGGPPAVEFVEMPGWDCGSRVLGLRWYSEKIIVVLTATHVDVFDLTTQQRIGRDLHDIRTVASNDFFDHSFDSSVSPSERQSFASSFSTYKRKLFLLGTVNVRAGAILSWADRILSLMQPATILSAIETTTAYLEGQVDASTISLPSDPLLRRSVVEPKLREILNASLDFVFSEERLRDGSHSDGESTRRLFEGLVGTCVRACHALDDVDWLFDELYERYEENGIEGIFLDRIEPFVLAGSVDTLPPSVSQRLIAIHEERRQIDAAQRIIVSVDPHLLDLNQALSLCQRHRLYDAMIHVYSRAMHDWVGPIVELLGLVRRIAQTRRRRPTRIGTFDDDASRDGSLANGTRRNSYDVEQEAELTAPDAYKVFAYLSAALLGLSHPRQTVLPFDEGVAARRSIYRFLFSGRTLHWPESGGRAVLTSDDDGADEPTYPYIRLLLHFDAEATLDTLDLAFEDPFLDDSSPNRQQIVDVLLEIVPPPSLSSSEFSPIDRTFLHIFVARNLPKYPQYISLSQSTLHDILVSLASDRDQSTIEDRQLASEYLLSTYSPPDVNAAIELFENAGFFRILRSIYRGERRWASLASTYLRDPDIGSDIFDFLRETLKLASRSSSSQRSELARTILDAVPSLIQADETGLQKTAEIVDAYLPAQHVEVVSRLASTPWRQFAYLRCLLEPSNADLPSTNSVASPADPSPSTRLEPSQRLLYLSLLARHEPQHVIRYLDSDDSIARTDDVLRVCEKEGAFDAVVWAMDRRGETKAALAKAEETIETRTDLLLQKLLQGSDDEQERGEDDGDVLDGRNADEVMAQIAAIAAAATKVCSVRSSGRRRSRELTPEDLWFGLLSSLVGTVRSIRSLVPTPERPSDRSSTHRRVSNASMILHSDTDDAAPGTLSPRASELLSTLIPSALSALVSTTSSREVSFPRLVRRLIESNARSPAAKRSYAEFKSIVGSMLDTYAFEGDLLDLSSKISSQDLFQHVERYKIERGKGWRPGAGVGALAGEASARGECAECLQPVWGPRGQGSSPAMSRSASVSMVVEQLGMTGRPRMKKRPSLKGKEVVWPPDEATSHRANGGSDGGFEGRPMHERERTASGVGIGGFEPPRGIVIGRDGRLWHHSCHLLRTNED